MKLIFKLKVSASYLEKQKSFIPKKNNFLAVVNFKTKKLCLLTQFSRRFCKQQGEHQQLLPSCSAQFGSAWAGNKNQNKFHAQPCHFYSFL